MLNSCKFSLGIKYVSFRKMTYGQWHEMVGIVYKPDITNEIVQGFGASGEKACQTVMLIRLRGK